MRRGVGAALCLTLAWAAVACSASEPRPDDKPGAAATASSSPVDDGAWPHVTHDAEYRDAEKGVEAALAEKYGSGWREDFVEVMVHDGIVSVFTSWSPGEDARRRGTAVCGTVASHVQEREGQGGFPADTQIIIHTEESDSSDTMAYFDVAEKKCRPTGLFLG
ncbi:hypothetical protein [Streptomyces sp. t39]|uniref:hypothetical protein n=1 Tax=Streptomyces sp. t39 TaxID=1828156 RepID=UPI0011CDA693|nr:hypothetical protein [Streptomyces sp. t39]TXS48273.1 hypothetical protein EAO77_31395 [Streptomyces sp. t39]